ncbi:MAG: Hpt domain-containing protein [Thermoproteota archaeon]
MSDEFLKIATAEINGEISEIQNILNSCHNNLDVSVNAAKIQKSTHKIKGLAPMMGKEELGSLSSLLDSVLKKIMDGAIVDEIFESLIDAVDEMKNSMTNSNYNLNEIKQRISKIISTP